jgi:hypothetical protein
LVQGERKATIDDLYEFVADKGRCTYKEMFDYMTRDIVAKGIIRVSKNTFLKYKKALENEGRIVNRAGVYLAETRTVPKAQSIGVLETMEVLSSPFVGDVRLYRMSSGSSYSIERMIDLLSDRLNLGHSIEIIRLESKVLDPNGKVIGNDYRYTALIFEDEVLKEIYLNADITTDYSGTSGSHHKIMEEFILNNKLEVTYVVDDFKNDREAMVRHLVRRGYL